MTLDPTTLWFVLVLTSFLQTCFLGGYALLGKAYAGVREWTASLGLLTLAALFTALRPVTPIWMWVVLPIIATLLAVGLLYYGIRRFFEQRLNPWWVLVAPGLGAVIAIVNTYVVDQPAWRDFGTTLIECALLAVTGYTILEAPERRRDWVYWPTSLALIGYAAFRLYRAVLGLSAPSLAAPTEEAIPPLQALNLSLWITGEMVLTVGLVLMLTRRVMAELAEKRHALEAANTTEAQAAARARQHVSELEALLDVDRALSGERDINTISRLVAEKLRQHFPAEATFLARYDPRTDLVSNPFFWVRHQFLMRPPRPLAQAGITKHVIQTRDTVLINERFTDHYPALGGVLLGADIPKSWLGVPIWEGGTITGVLSVQSLERENAFTQDHVRLLTLIAATVSAALQNARFSTDAQQRVHALQSINEISHALTAHLDLAAISRLVAEKLHELFHADVAFLALVDEAAGVIRRPFYWQRGEFVETPPTPLTQGLTPIIIRTQEPLLINEHFAERSEELGAVMLSGNNLPLAWLGVPLWSEERVIGALSVQSLTREHAFSPDDVHLLTTIAANVGAAVRNAQLYAKSLQRNKQLEILQGITLSLTAQVELQAVLETVVQSIRQLLKGDYISIYLAEAGQPVFKIGYREGHIITQLPQPPRPGGSTDIILRTGHMLIIPDMERHPIFAGYGARGAFIGLPLKTGENIIGVVSFGYPHPRAFADEEVTLAQLFADQTAIALENARLFAETQRLFQETEQRNAELAAINSVQSALVGELNAQNIYDAVGDKIRASFHQADIDIRIYDPETNLVHFPYAYEHGQRLVLEALPLHDVGFSAHVLRTRETLVINEDMAHVAAQYGATVLPGTQMERSAIYVPLVVGHQARGLLVLTDMEHEHAFNQADVRLLQAIANNMSIALESARLLEATQKALRINQGLSQSA